MSDYKDFKIDYQFKPCGEPYIDAVRQEYFLSSKSFECGINIPARIEKRKLSKEARLLRDEKRFDDWEKRRKLSSGKSVYTKFRKDLRFFFGCLSKTFKEQYPVAVQTWCSVNPETDESGYLKAMLVDDIVNYIPWLEGDDRELYCKCRQISLEWLFEDIKERGLKADYQTRESDEGQKIYSDIRISGHLTSNVFDEEIDTTHRAIKSIKRKTDIIRVLRILGVFNNLEIFGGYTQHHMARILLPLLSRDDWGDHKMIRDIFKDVIEEDIEDRKYKDLIEKISKESI